MVYPDVSWLFDKDILLISEADVRMISSSYYYTVSQVTELLGGLNICAQVRALPYTSKICL